MSDEETPRTPETEGDEQARADEPGTEETGSADELAQLMEEVAEDAREMAETDDAAETAAAASTFVPGETPVMDPGSSLPSFLTHSDIAAGVDEEPSDDPEPLSHKFEVIDGGTGVWDALEPQTAEASEPQPQQTDIAPASAAGSKKLAAGAAGAVNAVGSFLSQGASAVREMSAAKKALADARAELETLEKRVDEQSRELERRQKIEENFDAIVAQEQANKATAQKNGAAAEVQRDALQKKIDELKAKLETVREEDAQTERRLKAAVDAAEAKEASSREAGKRLTRRLDDAKRMYAKAEEERKTGVEAIQGTIDSAQARLKTLREEYAQIQRNPSLNSANYSIRTSELSTEISDAADELRKATEDLPRVTAELDRTLDTARKAVEAATEPIKEAESAHRAVTAAADAARADYQNAREASTERQRDLREQIAAQEKEQRAQGEAIKQAAEDAKTAQAHIDEATDIHEHPEATEALAGALGRDREELKQQTAEVNQLEVAEQRVRETTRGSRVKFIGAVAIAVVAIVVIIVLWLVLS